MSLSRFSSSLAVRESKLTEDLRTIERARGS